MNINSNCIISDGKVHFFRHTTEKTIGLIRFFLSRVKPCLLVAFSIMFWIIGLFFANNVEDFKERADNCVYR